MEIWSAPIVDTRVDFEREREALLELLADLSESHWTSAPSAGAWVVKDVALHLLDRDLTRLSASRDGDPAGLLPITDDNREFAHLLAAKNDRWLLATRYLSARVTRDLLRFSTAQIVDWIQTRTWLRRPV